MSCPTTVLPLARWPLAVGICVLSAAATADPSVSGTTISWPDDGWYEVQSADGSESVCSGGSSCDVSPGTYLVINHSTGQRFNDIMVSGPSNPAPPTSPAPDGVAVNGGTISWPDDGWYQVQSADGATNVCSGGTSCDVSPGTYLVINHSTGQRFSDVVVDGSSNPTTPTNPPPSSDGVGVTGNTISWPEDGWYQVQTADGATNVCSGGRSCDVSPGSYLVINHSTGERFSGIEVGGSSGPTEPTTPPTAVDSVTVTGTTIRWPDDGWYQIQNATDYQTVCEGGTSCDVSAGTFIVINHSNGNRQTVDVSSGDGGTPPVSTTTVEVNFEITVPVYVSNALQVRINWGDTELMASWLVDETWQVTGNLPADTEHPLSVVFSDDNGGTTLGSYDTSFLTGSQGAETYRVTAGQFDTQRWDADGDGTSNLAELRAGSDPYVFGITSPPVSTTQVEVNFEITVPFVVSNALQVRVIYGDADLSAAWLIDESWSVSGDFPADTESALSVIFYDDNRGTTLASFDTSFRTGSETSEVFTVTVDQFDSERWDSDSDGTSNLAERRVGTDPFVVETYSPTGPTAPVALNISTYSGYDVELFWPRATDDGLVMGYDIFRNGQLLESMVDALSYYDPTTEPEREYIYTVYAVDNDGNRSRPTSASTFTPADQPVSGIEAQYGTISGGSANRATWVIGDGMTTTNGAPTGGSCTSRGGAGSGVGVREGTLRPQNGSTQYDAYDNASLMWINGEQVGGFLRATTDTTSNYATVPLSGLQVTAQYHAISSMATLRNYTTLRNDTGSDIFAVVNFTSNFGSDGSTRIYSTSSGDTSFGSDDRWVVTDDGSAFGGDPANVTVFSGPGTPESQVVFAQTSAFNCWSTNGLNARLDVIVPAGTTRALMFFHHLSPSSVNADIEAAQFDTNPFEGSSLIEGLNQQQLSEIVNWNF